MVRRGANSADTKRDYKVGRAAGRGKAEKVPRPQVVTEFHITLISRCFLKYLDNYRQQHLSNNEFI
jgi:hypothetical protein